MCYRVDNCYNGRCKKLNVMFVRQIINEEIEELIWLEGFNFGDIGDFEKY